MPGNDIKLSIIVPVGRGDSSWRRLFETLLRMNLKNTEILFSFSEPINDLNFEPPFFAIHSSQGRAIQQNRAGKNAKGIWILFLHSDSRITQKHLDHVIDCLSKNDQVFYYFDLKFSDRFTVWLLLNEWGANFRSRILKLPFGDQGFFMARSTFKKLGFFNETAIYGEDHLLVWMAHSKKIKVASCKMSLLTSARKYKSKGWAKTTFEHFQLTVKQALPEAIRLIRSRI